MTVAVVAPTERWRAAAPELPPLPGTAHDTAERLLLLLHYGIDWESGWVGARRERYWSITFRSGSGSRRTAVAPISTDGGQSQPRHWTRRPATPPSGSKSAHCLREPPRPVLVALRESTTALVLRTQIITSLYRDSRAQDRSRR